MFSEIVLAKLVPDVILLRTTGGFIGFAWIFIGTGFALSISKLSVRCNPSFIPKLRSAHDFKGPDRGVQRHTWK